MSTSSFRNGLGGFVRTFAAILIILLQYSYITSAQSTTTGPLSGTTTTTTRSTSTSKLPSECAYLECQGTCCYFGQLCRHSEKYGFICVFRDDFTTLTRPETTITTVIDDPITTILIIDTRPPPTVPPRTTTTTTTSTSATGTTQTSRAILTNGVNTGVETSNTATSSASSTSAAGGGAGDGTSGGGGGSSKNKTGTYVGIAIGAVFFFFGLIALIVYIRKLHSRKREQENLQQQVNAANSGAYMQETPAYPYNRNPELGSTALVEMGHEYKVYEVDGRMIAVANPGPGAGSPLSPGYRAPVYYWDGNGWVRDEEDGRNWGSNVPPAYEQHPTK